jgi:putative addiction module antidote
MLIQKIYRNGNSLAVTIPKQYLEDLSLIEGSQVVVEKKGNGILLTTKKQTLAPDVDGKFMKMVDSFIDKHEDVLQKLANK